MGGVNCRLFIYLHCELPVMCSMPFMFPLCGAGIALVALSGDSFFCL